MGPFSFAGAPRLRAVAMATYAYQAKNSSNAYHAHDPMGTLVLHWLEPGLWAIERVTRGYGFESCDRTGQN
jgi:hypothetical protein